MKIDRDCVRTRTNDAGLLAIRAMLGVVFVFHGGQKLFGLFGGHGLTGMASFLEGMGVPFPMVNAVLAGSAEFFGGLALLSGFGVRVASVPLVITMLVAAFTAHGGAFSSQNGGMEYPLTLAVVSAGIGLTGAGRLTVVGAIGAASGQRANTTAQAPD